MHCRSAKRWGFFLSVCCWLIGSTQIAASQEDEAFKNAIREFNSKIVPPIEAGKDDLRKLADAVFQQLCIVEKRNKDKLDCLQWRLDQLFQDVTNLDAAKVDENQKKAIETLVKNVKDPTLKGKLEAALNVPSPPAPAPKPSAGKVHIVAAFFGHLDDIVYAMKKYGSFRKLSERSYISPRLCPATRAIRKECQGKAACLDGVAFSGATLCGYEPAQYAEPRMRALVIRYQCITDKDWSPETNFTEDADADKIDATPPSPDTLAHNELRSPPNAAGDPVLRGRLRWALLRQGEVTRITCALPKEPAAKSAQQ
jgi:hypothetical protein